LLTADLTSISTASIFDFKSDQTN